MNIAVLIDAENVLPAFADQIFTQAAALGTVTHKEIYGAAQALNNWVEPVLKYAIHPNLTIRPTKYKNSSDIALVIGAMDLMSAVETVVIASSDSDFSSLSVRLRAAGISVVGMGTEKANPLWRTACSSFVTLETAKPAQQAKQQPKQPQQNQQQKQQNQQQKQNQPSQPQKQPQQEQQAPKQQPEAAPQAKVAATHAERTAIIRTAIQTQLDAGGGKVQSSALFTALNALPEYRYDQQRSRRKPRNYLMRQFGEVFRFEEDSDGVTWLMPVSAEPVSAEKQAAAEAAEEPGAPAEPAAPDQETALLLNAGIPAEDAARILEICHGSANLRAAYNQLRAVFGSAKGRAYYQTVKDLGEKR